MIKIFEDFEKTDVELKKLISYFQTFIESFGYTVQNYLDRRTWEMEFFNSPSYSFCMKMKIDMFSKNYDIDLTLINSLATDDPFSIQLAEYLKTISGIKFIREEHNPFGNKLGTKYEYSIKGNINIDKIINQLNKEDFELKTSSNKYNL